MTSPADLTTLANVKAWLTGNPPIGATDDTLLGRLITSASRFILSTLARDSILPATWNDVMDGTDGDRMMLRRYPVTSIVSLTVCGSAVTASSPAPTGAGYLLQAWQGIPPGRPQLMYRVGGYFPRGKQNVAVSYVAGYAIQGEAQTVPATPFQLNALAPYGLFSGDRGVTYAVSGTALTKVASSPTIGQYAVNATGQYTFAAADTNAAVLISYAFIPSDLEQACIEFVAERYRYKGRIGVVSESQGGHVSTSFSQKDMSDAIRSMIEPFRNVIPIA